MIFIYNRLAVARSEEQIKTFGPSSAATEWASAAGTHALRQLEGVQGRAN